MWPSGEVLARFGVRAVAPLGGRLNRHWLVDAHGERLVLRRWADPGDAARRSSARSSMSCACLSRVAALGWPVATALGEPVTLAGRVWCLFPFLPGDPPSATDPSAEQRARGRLLAIFHADLARIDGLGSGRLAALRGDPGRSGLDRVLAEHERERAEEVRMLRWHSSAPASESPAYARTSGPARSIHGDFTAWNLRFQDGQLSGILDFELAHRDHRIADFALSWRGIYDAVIHGYAEVAPLEPEEWELLTPMWWAFLIGVARAASGGRDARRWLDRQATPAALPADGPGCARVPLAHIPNHRNSAEFAPAPSGEVAFVPLLYRRPRSHPPPP